MKKIIAILLCVTLMFTFCVSAFAVNDDSSAGAVTITNQQTQEYTLLDGTKVEVLSFLENGVSSSITRSTAPDGAIVVTAVSGDQQYIFEGQADVFVPAPNDSGISTYAVTYPYYTDYWFAGNDFYNLVAATITVTTIASVMAAALGATLDQLFDVATNIYDAYYYYYLDYYGGTSSHDNLYFRTSRFYATLEYGPGAPTIWYNKFITSVYATSSYTGYVSGPWTNIYETSSPML